MGEKVNSINIRGLPNQKHHESLGDNWVHFEVIVARTICLLLTQHLLYLISLLLVLVHETVPQCS